MNYYQARKIIEIRNVILDFQLWETFLSVKANIDSLDNKNDSPQFWVFGKQSYSFIEISNFGKGSF